MATSPPSYPPGYAAIQPFKGLWSLFAISYNLARLPLWFVIFIPRFLRQSPKYSYSQALRVRILRAALYQFSLIRIRIPESLSPGPEKHRFVVIKPAATSPEGKSRYLGPTICDPETTPKAFGATWYPAPPAPTTKDSSGAPEDVKAVVLHFHGGAYAIGDGRTKDAGFAAKQQIENTRASHVLAPQYRLSSNGNRFPAQLQDAISSYCYLLFDLHIPARNIIVAGDSAGGNLALGLLRYIADEGAAAGIPSPAAGFIWSPWVSPVSALHNCTEIASSFNYSRDYLNDEFATWGATNMVPPAAVTKKTGVGLDHPTVDFRGKPFKSATPMFVSVGENEVLYSDCLALVKEMKELNGRNVVLDVQEACPHDVILTGPVIGFEVEAAAAAKRAGAWEREVGKRASL